MSENTGEVKRVENKVSRRDFLKKAITVAGITASGFALTAPSLNVAEKDAVENGISSGSGIFVPLYETHFKELDPARISRDLDILLRERGGGGIYTGNPSYVLSSTAGAYGDLGGRKEFRYISDAVLERMAKNETEIMLGDVTTETSRFPLTIIEGGTEFIAGLGISLALLKDSLKGKKPVMENNVTRRKFLKGAAAIGASWLMMPGIYGLLRGGTEIGTVATERDNALTRIIDRIYGIQSNLHPEMLEEGMFRNLIMADKMLTVAEDFEKRTGRKARIGFNVEYAHTGIEDFLRVGHDVCRWIIERYPTNVLKYIAELNGGGESLWTARLLKLPEDLSPGPNAQWDKVADRKVVDVELQKALASKLK